MRRTWKNYSKLGRGRKKKQVWRKPTGRDNKMREKKKGYPAVVSIGYRTDKKIRNTIENKKPKIVNNLKDLESMKKNEIAILSRIGKKKKMEIVKKAKEMKIEIHNLNIKKWLKKINAPLGVPQEGTSTSSKPQSTELGGKK